MSGTRVATIGNNLLLFVQTVWEVMKICYGGHFSTLLSCFIVYWRHQLYLLIPIYRAVQTLALAILLSLPWPTGQPKNHQVATSTNVYLNFGHFTHTFKTINHVGRPTYIVYVIPLGAAYFILFIGPTADGLIILLQNRHWTLDTSWRRTADLLLKVGKIVLILFSCLPHCTDNKNVTTPFDDLIASRPWQMMEQQQCISNNNNWQQQQQHRLSLGRNYPGGGEQCQQRWRSPAVRWCCGRCCCAAVVPSGHASHCSGHVGTCFPPHCI